MNTFENKKRLNFAPTEDDTDKPAPKKTESNVMRIHRNAIRWNICRDLVEAANDPQIDTSMIYVLLDREMTFYEVVNIPAPDKPIEGDIYVKEDFFFRRRTIRSDFIGDMTPEEFKADIMKAIRDAFNYRVELVDVPANAERFSFKLENPSMNLKITYNNLSLIPGVDYHLDLDTRTVYLRFVPSNKPAIVLIEERVFTPGTINDADTLGGLPPSYYASRDTIERIFVGDIPVGDSNKLNGKTLAEIEGGLIVDVLSRLGLLQNTVKETVTTDPNILSYNLTEKFGYPFVVLNGVMLDPKTDYTLINEGVNHSIHIDADIMMSLSPFIGRLMIIEHQITMNKNVEGVM
ncbi:MAG: hypothetical protein ACRC92_24105 [Peptostreptococcaceae bacterium]